MSAGAVDRALVTLTAGTRFLSHRAESGRLSAAAGSRAGHVDARHLANCLAELDRFFHVLLDALDPRAPDHRHNAANKLTALRRADPGAPGDPLRLRALGRSRACLRWCNGTVRRPDTPALPWMTTGWIDPATRALRRYPLGERLAPDGTDIAGICAFYDRLAVDLLARA